MSSVHIGDGMGWLPETCKLPAFSASFIRGAGRFSFFLAPVHGRARSPVS